MVMLLGGIEALQRIGVKRFTLRFGTKAFFSNFKTKDRLFVWVIQVYLSPGVLALLSQGQGKSRRVILYLF